MSLLEKARANIEKLVEKGILNKDEILHLELSDKNKFKLQATLKDGDVVHFGMAKSTTFLEGADEKKRQLYLARASKIRNKKGEYTYKIKFTRSFLSYWILWN